MTSCREQQYPTRILSCSIRRALWYSAVLQGRAADDLAGWQAAPFAEAVLGQRRSWPLPWAAAHLLRCAHI